MMDRRSPLSRARGLGAAGTGTEHWWLQRLTAIANIFLVFGVLILLVMQAGKSYQEIKICLSGFIPTLTLVSFIFVTSFHAILGLQVVIEDYVHHRALNLSFLILVRFGFTALALASILMTLHNFFNT